MPLEGAHAVGAAETKTGTAVIVGGAPLAKHGATGSVHASIVSAKGAVTAPLAAGAGAERRSARLAPEGIFADAAAALSVVGAAADFIGLAHRRRRRSRGCTRRGCARRGRSSRCSCSGFTRAQVVAVAQVAINRAQGDLLGLLVRRARFMADGELLLLS